MIRTLLTTTALAAVLTTGALAASDMKKTEMDSATGAGSAVFSTSPDTAPMQSKNGYFAASTDQILASSLIGSSLYNGAGEDASNIGEVNDVVLSRTGNAEAIVVGVGGFLGIGAKDVAVDFERVSWVERDGERWLTISATQKELENAPAFDRSMIEPSESAMATDTTPMAGTSSGTMTGDKSAAATDPAMTTGSDMAATDTQPAPVKVSAASAEQLIGTAVYGAQDENLGEVRDVIVSGEGQVEAFIIDVGGFLGIGAKPVSMALDTLDIKEDANGDLRIHTSYTQEQLEALPEYSGNAGEAKPAAAQ
ncbi:PRC-barrel domain-containing protein [Stappia sp.]|jgi:sporulation protein YlmC with PRC-barrel domain|uniref:PRC-barrel domain-containing protein n=1 Tax=Stappia sp. TaxID=1870903 RepID=UPI003A998C06